MKIVKTKLQDVFIIEPQVFGDNRGWFLESWSRKEMEKEGLDYDFIQDNHSYSKEKGTLRGLHLQRGAFSQAKLVRCVRGAVLDVAVDLRIGSPTFKKWVAVELSAENKMQLLIPRGFAHAFLTLADDVEFQYKVDNVYEPKEDRSIAWNDPDIGIEWPISDPILSDKDQKAPFLKESNLYFEYEVE